MIRTLIRFVAFAALVMVHAAGPVIAGEEGDKFLDIKKVTSASGITAWLVEDHTTPVIAMKIAFKGAGARNDPLDKQGLALMASNTMDEGAAGLDAQAFQKALEDKSIALRFASGRDDFTARLKTLTKYKDTAFDLLRKSLTQPRFDEEAVNRMRSANLARIRNSMTDPEWIAARLQNDIVFAGHAYAKNSGGTLTTLQAITAKDLHDFVADMITRNRLHIAVAGDITAKELEKNLDRIFADLPAGAAKPPEIAPTKVQNKSTTVVFEKDMPQTLIRMAQKGIDRHDPDYYSAQVMNFILGSSGFGSRLMSELREKRGLTYGIYTAFRHMDAVDILSLSTSTQNASAGDVLGLIRDEWEKLRNEKVSEEELEQAKDYLIGSMPLSLSSTDNIAAIVLSLQLQDLPVTYLDSRADKIRTVTRDDVLNVSRRILSPDNLVTILVGAPVDVEPTGMIDSLPNVE